MIVKLTARTVGSIKPTPGKRAEYFDTEVSGLALRVTERGRKSWAVMYRHRGRLRRLTLGSADTITLADARDRARDAIRDASKGIDAATLKHEARKAETISDLATIYIEKYARASKRSWKADDRILRAEILPKWRQRAIRDITRRDVIAMVEKIAERGAPILANRTTALVSKLFNVALNRGLIDASPAVRIPRPAPERTRDRVLTEAEIRTLWEEFEALSPEMAAFYKLRLLTAQRGAEVSTMRWQDIELDAGWWTIPAERSKNKLPHRVPLAPTVIALLGSLKPTTLSTATGVMPAGLRTQYVLYGARGKRQQAEAAATFTVTDFRGHDLRRTAASIMASGGVSRLVIGKILNHVERDITRVYDRHSYDPEKRTALDWWALRLRAILENKSANVLAFQRGA